MARISCAAGNGRFWNIHRTHPMWVHAITIYPAKRKNHCEGPGTNKSDELIRAIGQSSRNINKDGHADGLRRFPNVWKKVIYKGRLYWRYINVVPLWLMPCQKYRTISITCYPIFVSMLMTVSYKKLLVMYRVSNTKLCFEVLLVQCRISSKWSQSKARWFFTHEDELCFCQEDDCRLKT